MRRILEFRIVRLISLIFFSLLGFCIVSPGALAEEKFERSGFWGGVDFGVGFVQQSFAGIEEDEKDFFLGFEGGYTLNQRFIYSLFRGMCFCFGLTSILLWFLITMNFIH